ncbi:MAG: HD domain-containing protein [Caldisericaceae bacterium]|nr:HD domain-containing protein [Caldisericaceae bacterium]
MNRKISEIIEIVKKELSSSAHDLEHTFRVLKLAKRIAEKEGKVNMEVIELAALLHDIARVKEDSDKTGNTDHAVLGAEMARKILSDLGYPNETVDAVCHAIRTHRFRGENVPETIEAKILFDADKLDAIGAVGIARAYMIAGERGEPLYREVSDLDAYKKENLVGGKLNGRIKDISKHSVNIEYETKFKKIPGRLFTETARKIAKDRLEFMAQYFGRLKKEIEGEA